MHVYIYSLRVRRLAPVDRVKTPILCLVMRDISIVVSASLFFLIHHRPLSPGFGDICLIM